MLTVHRCHGSIGFTLQKEAYSHDCNSLSVISPAWILFLLHGRGNAGGVPENRQANY